MAVRAWSPESLARRVAWLRAAGIFGGWVEPEAGKGPAYEFTDPDGHRIRIYYETSNFRTYGTPPVGAPEESVTSDWPSPA
jgi:catechol 2,3-dioxygenase